MNLLWLSCALTRSGEIPKGGERFDYERLERNPNMQPKNEPTPYSGARIIDLSAVVLANGRCYARRPAEV